MKMELIPIQFSHELQKGMIIRQGFALMQVCRKVKDFYVHPTAGVVRNVRRNKVWVTPVDNPKAEPVLACFDIILGESVKVYLPLTD